LLKALITIAFVAVLVLTGCSSPSTTGIKVHIQNGDYTRAIALADSVLAGTEAGNAEVWYWKARAHSFQHDWENAAMAFGQTYRLDPTRKAEIADFWTAFYNTANSRFTGGDIPGAMEMLDLGAEIAPDRPEFPQMKGDILLNQGETAEALDRFEDAFNLGTAMVSSIETELATEADPSRKEFLENEYYRVLSGAVLSSYNSARILENLYLQTEDEALKQEYAARAVSMLESGIALDPTNPDLLETMAEIYLIQGKYDEALAVFDNAEASIGQNQAEGWITPEEADAMRGELMLTRGFALLEMERSEEALQQLEASRALLGDTYKVLATIAHANVLLERYEQSLEVLRQALTLPGLEAGEMANLYYMEFVNESRLERDQASLEALLSAIQYDPENAMYYEYLASTYSRLGRRQQAIDAMEKAEELRSRQQ
jgi:superkiller protein 3